MGILANMNVHARPVLIFRWLVFDFVRQLDERVWPVPVSDNLGAVFIVLCGQSDAGVFRVSDHPATRSDRNVRQRFECDGRVFVLATLFHRSQPGERRPSTVMASGILFALIRAAIAGL